MKLIKGLLAIALISIIAVSCKETKKEDLKEVIEVTETTDESTEVTDKNIETTDQSTDAANEKADATAHAAEENIETTTTGVEEVDVEEGVIIEAVADTPVIYPGCKGTNEEIRACSIKQFKAFFRKHFNTNLANQLDLEEGDHKIVAMVKIDKTGNFSVLKIDAENVTLEKEVIRVINKLPQMTPATKNGAPVDVSFVIPFDFKVVH